jgi:putative heme-binding domain-containing protein
VLRLRIERNGATYKVLSREDLFIDPPEDFRPVGICLAPDGLGIYICDWQHRDTKENVSVGKLLKLTYTGKSSATPKPDWYLPAAMGNEFHASTSELVSGLSHPAASVRLVAQRRIAERAVQMETSRPTPSGYVEPTNTIRIRDLEMLLVNTNLPSFVRWHALWTMDALNHGNTPQFGVNRFLNDPDPSLRRQTIRLLGQRWPSFFGSPASILKLKDSDASVRFQAATALGKAARWMAVPGLLSALREEEDLFVRYAIFTALNRIGLADADGDAHGWRLAVEALKSDSSRVREGAVLGMRETYSASLARALARIVGSQLNSIEARVAAIELLTQIHRKRPAWKGEWWAYHPVNSPPPSKSDDWEGTPIIEAALSGALTDTNTPVQLAAVNGVGETKLSSAALPLRRIFSSATDLQLKRGILAALGAIRDSASVELLTAVLKEPEKNSALLGSAVVAAGQIGTPESAALLVEFLKSRPADKATVINALGTVGASRVNGAADAVAGWTGDLDAEIRQAAFNALESIGGDSAVAVLVPLVQNPSADIRRDAVTTLGEIKARSAIPSLLAAFQNAETKQEAVGALARMPDVQALDAYLDGLSGKNPTSRAACRKAIESIRSNALPLIESKLDALTPETIGELQAIYAKDSEARKGRLFEAKAKIREPAEYLQFALKHDGDAARGRQIFADASGVACIKCHRVQGEGGDVGPDLSTAGTQFGKAELAESVLFPSRAIREGYQRVEVETKNDETFEGLVKTESNETLTLRDANGGSRQIAKADIKDRRNSQLSLMPDGLEAALTLDDFADLMAYLVSLKGRQ